MNNRARLIGHNLTPRNMEKGLILVVDDDPASLRALVEHLGNAGLNVLVAPGGNQALLQLERIQPDLILLDVLMLEIDGFETCRRLKNHDLTRDVPVIFMTALSDTIDKVKGFEVGGVDYLTKPLQYQEVLSRVNTHLKIRRLQEQLKAQNIRLEEQNVLLGEKNERLYQEIAEREQAEKVLNETLKHIELVKQEWESTADSLSHVICLLDDQMCIIRANRTVEHWGLGQVFTVKGQHMHDLLHPACHDPGCYLKKFLDQAQQEIAQHRPIEREVEDALLHRYLNIQLRPVSDYAEREWQPSASFAACMVHDITKQKHAEHTLQQRTRELTLLNRMSNALHACRMEEETYQVVVDACRQIFYFTSGSLCVINDEQSMPKKVASWGDPPDEIQKFGIDDPWIFDHDKTGYIKHPDTGRLYTHIGHSADNKYLCVPISVEGGILAILSMNFEPYHPAYSTDQYTYRLEASRIILASVAENYALMLVNLRLRESLRRESLRDPLTGLYNRRHMEASLLRESRRAHRRNSSLGVMMLDVDHFKNFNDRYSHEAGDVVLQELGALLQRHIRAEDIACRYGGEEFTLILPDASLEHTRLRAEELRIMVKEFQIRYHDLVLNITISIGVATLPCHGLKAKDVVNAADAALYQAKAEGRDRVVIAPSQ